MGKSYNIYSLIQREWKLLLSLFLVGFLFYIYPICHQAITIDNEKHIVCGTFDWYLLSKRWGITLIQKIFFLRTFVPSFWIIVNVAFLALAAILSCDLFHFSKQWIKYVFGIIIISFPQYSYMMEFACTADAVGVGLFFVTWALWIFMRSDSWKANLAVLLLLIGTFSIYVSLIFIPLALFLFSGFVQISSGEASIRNWLKSLIRLGIITALAFGLYHMISIGILKYYGLSTQTPQYFTRMIRWGKDPFMDIIHRIPLEIWRHLTGKAYYGERSYTLVWIPFVFLAFFSCFQKVSTKQKLFSLALLVVALIAPFTQILLLGHGQPPRVFFAQPFFFATIICIVLNKLPRISPQLILSCVFVLFVHNGYRATQVFHYSSIEEQADKILMQRIIGRLDNLHLVLEDHKILIVGAFNCFPDYPQNNSSYRSLYKGIGRAYFAQGNKTAAPQKLFVHGYTRSLPQIPSKEQIRSLASSIEQLPAWPAEGSIALIDNVIIIKLSNRYDLKKQYGL